MKVAPLPASIQVGAVMFEVRCTDDNWMRVEHASQSKGNYGFTEAVPAIISLNPSQSADNMRLTLWHETMHALHEAVMGAPSWDNLGDDESCHEENVIRRWEHPTLAVLRDNPELVAYLIAE